MGKRLVASLALRKHARTAISHGCKNDNFQMKNCDIFLIFAQNIDCGYTLDPPQTSSHNLNLQEKETQVGW